MFLCRIFRGNFQHRASIHITNFKSKFLILWRHTDKWFLSFHFLLFLFIVKIPQVSIDFSIIIAIITARSLNFFTRKSVSRCRQKHFSTRMHERNWLSFVCGVLIDWSAKKGKADPSSGEEYRLEFEVFGARKRAEKNAQGAEKFIDRSSFV